jgi:hypothetical protein
MKYDYNEEIKVRTGSHKKKFIVDIDEEDADIVVERPASIEDPKVKYECDKFRLRSTYDFRIHTVQIIQ